MPVHFRRDGTIAFVELDHPPVNTIGLETRTGLLAAIEWVTSQQGLERVILTGRGSVFAAGGDAREFDAPPQAPHLPDILGLIEQSHVPWIAAINGTALGGGLELALACRARVATADASLGLPEVTLGVVPGAGGTQRLPRLVGLELAARMIAQGRPISGREALTAGLVDYVDTDVVAFACALEISQVVNRVPTSQRKAPVKNDKALDVLRNEIAQKSAGQIAPAIALQLVALSAEVPFDAAIKTERENFIKLRGSQQARALRHIFFAERAARAPSSLAEVTPAQLDKAVVVGGGTMGAGIAWALLSAGISVVLLETDPDACARATSNFEKIVNSSIKTGHITEADVVKRRNLLMVTTDYAQGKGAGLAIEAAFENIQVKTEIFKKLEAALGGDTILATNTSYLDVNAIAANLSDPSRLLGLHFFAPAHVMKLLEIVRGEKSSDKALVTGYALAKRLKKIPVLAGVCDGFIGNRILARYREAADTMMMDGSNPWEVDEAMVGFGYAMGPYAAQDLSGLDIAHANRRRLDATRDPSRRYIPIADRMVQEGRLGRKVGVGWYRYPVVAV
jgi:3-hydroxyacyl-CoA dehydrogenase